MIDYCRKAGIPALEIHHDYEGVAKWAQGLWKANKPGTQAYAALCREAARDLKLSFVKVKGHSGNALQRPGGPPGPESPGPIAR